MTRASLSGTDFTRRRFLRTSGLALAAPSVLSSRVLGRAGVPPPSERIGLGAIGIGPRGRYVLSSLLEEPDVQCLAVCDVQAERRDQAKKLVDDKNGNRDCAAYRDLFELLARPDIDAVLIATGDRWHALASILAIKAGKDVYSEKPCAITMGECGELADTAHRYSRVFQAGTQRRSIPNFQRAAALALTGRLGQLHTLHASVYRPAYRYHWLPAQPEPPGDVLDWERWLGPSPWRPYHPQYARGGWRGFYGLDAGATLLDWGAHTVDLCQMANGSDHTAPIEFVPGKNEITARYANGVRLVLPYLEDPFGDRSPQFQTRLGTCPVRYEGDEGWVETGDSGDIDVSSDTLRNELRTLKHGAVGTHPGSHVRNFLDCVRSRGRPAAHVDVMRRSHVASHAAAIAWQLDRAVKFDPVREAFIDDDEANRLRSRAKREPWHV